MQSSHQLSLLKSHICSTMFCTVSKYMFCHGTEHMVCHIPLSTGTYILPCSAKCRNVQDYIFFHVPDTGACLQWLPVCIHTGRIHSPLPGCSREVQEGEGAGAPRIFLSPMLQASGGAGVCPSLPSSPTSC